VILDLEDAVASKVSARQALVAHPLDPDHTVVRVSSVTSGELEEDLSAGREAGYDTVMLAKMSTPEDVQHLDDLQVVALCERARGALGAPAIAGEPSGGGSVWGGEDLIVPRGGRSDGVGLTTGPAARRT